MKQSSLGGWVSVGKQGKLSSLPSFVPATSVPTIDEILLDRGLERVSNPGKGNCVGYAVVPVLRKTHAYRHTTQVSFRASIVCEMRANPARYSPYIAHNQKDLDSGLSFPSYKAYVDNIALDGEFMGNVEWMAAQHAFPLASHLWAFVKKTGRDTVVRVYLGYDNSTEAEKAAAKAAKNVLTAADISSLRARGFYVMYFTPGGGGHYEETRFVDAVPLPSLAADKEEEEIFEIAEALPVVSKKEKESGGDDDDEEEKEDDDEEEDVSTNLNAHTRSTPSIASIAYLAHFHL